MSTSVSGAALISQTGLAVIHTTDLNLSALDYLSLHAVYADATPAAKTFVDGDVDVDANTITKAAHGFFTGLKVAATTDGVLPAGTSATNYWIIRVSATVFKLASSLALATAGTAVDITAAAGGGTHTLTPVTLLTTGGVLKLQCSNDGTNFTDIAATPGGAASQTVTITAAGNVMFDLGRPSYRYVRALYTPTTGAINLTVTINAENT